MNHHRNDKKLIGNLEKKQIQAYFDFFDKSNLHELTIEEEGVKWTLRKKKPLPPQYSSHLLPPAANLAPAPVEELETKTADNETTKNEEISEEEGQKVTSPIVGTFYASSSPEAPPYVQVGTAVKKGQTLCIVEAMKIMNEIVSPFDGTVQQIKVKNAQPVKADQVLLIIT